MSDSACWRWRDDSGLDAGLESGFGYSDKARE